MKLRETLCGSDLVQCWSQLSRAKEVRMVEVKGCITMVHNERKGKWSHVCANVTSRPKLIVSWTKAGRVHGTIEPAALNYIWSPFGDNRRFQASKFSLVTYYRFVFNESIQTVVLNVNKFSNKPDAKGKENLEMISLSLSFKISQLRPENSCNLVLSCQITVAYVADNICYKKRKMSSSLSYS